MAIRGISGFSNYQALYNDYRLQVALQNNPQYKTAVQPVSKVSSAFGSGSTSDSMKFLKEYSSVMSDLMKSSNSLRSVNASGALSDMAVSSSDSSVATATEKYNVKTAKDMELDVQQVAQAQQNVSTGVTGSEAAVQDMSFSIAQNSGGSIDVSVSSMNENGTAKSNRDMLREAADQINKAGGNVAAQVVEKDGVSSLQITGKSTGSQNGFEITGDMGAASGAQSAARAAQDARYSVTENGRTSSYTSASNEISLDMARIGVNLVSQGKTTISAKPDSEKVASAVSDFVKSYNSALKVLNDNADRGTGVERQLRSLLTGMGSSQSLKQMGISTKKDGTLSLDEELLKKNLDKDPKLTKDLIGGASGLGQTGFTKATSAISANSASLINNDLMRAQEESYTNPLTYMNLLSKGGARNLNNYYALGMMVNYLV